MKTLRKREQITPSIDSVSKKVDVVRHQTIGQNQKSGSLRFTLQEFQQLFADLTIHERRVAVGATGCKEVVLGANVLGPRKANIQATEVLDYKIYK